MIKWTVLLFMVVLMLSVVSGVPMFTIINGMISTLYAFGVSIIDVWLSIFNV